MKAKYPGIYYRGILMKRNRFTDDNYITLKLPAG